MEIYTTSQAREKLFKIVEHVTMSHDPVYIVSKKKKVVILSEEDYEAMKETLYLSSIPGMKESLIKASKGKKEDFVEEINWDEL
jgi:antitoxin YefM